MLGTLAILRYGSKVNIPTPSIQVPKGLTQPFSPLIQDPVSTVLHHTHPVLHLLGRFVRRRFHVPLQVQLRPKAPAQGSLLARTHKFRTTLEFKILPILTAL